MFICLLGVFILDPVDDHLHVKKSLYNTKKYIQHNSIVLKKKIQIEVFLIMLTHLFFLSRDFWVAADKITLSLGLFAFSCMPNEIVCVLERNTDLHSCTFIWK